MHSRVACDCTIMLTMTGLAEALSRVAVVARMSLEQHRRSWAPQQSQDNQRTHTRRSLLAVHVHSPAAPPLVLAKPPLQQQHAQAAAAPCVLAHMHVPAPQGFCAAPPCKAAQTPAARIQTCAFTSMVSHWGLTCSTSSGVSPDSPWTSSAHRPRVSSLSLSPPNWTRP